MINRTLKQLGRALLLLFIIICAGTIGYIVIEGWNLSDSLYMVIITITTTGFEEVHPLSPTGRVFTLILLIISFAVVIYTGGIGVQILIESKILRRKRMQKNIGKLSGHYIVCGY